MGAALVGIGSAVFHPESSRVVRMVSGGQHGFAQAFFQVGGNAGSSLGPLLAAFIVLPHGQRSLAWFSVVALLGIIVLARVGSWSKKNRPPVRKSRSGEDRISSFVDAAQGLLIARRSDRSDVLEVLLLVEPEQLLHILFDE
jgi:FSR family fosmidomycin resistance protein-like MFS transporter